MSELTLDEWRRLLNQLNKIATGNAPEVLAVARDLAAEVPHDRVRNALADDALLETGAEYDTHPWESIRRDADNSELPQHDSTDTQESGSDRSNSPEDIEAPDETLGDVESPLEACIARVADTEYPPTAVAREIWVNWILDGTGRKRPVAPWQTTHAYPVEWHANLAAADRPETDFDTANRWAEFPLSAAGLSLPDDAQSDGLETGIILPNDRPAREQRLTLIDWDDVRDPDTAEIHPVVADYITRFGGYVEVSTSGTGLHQFVLGGLRKRGKFIAPIDDDPFVPGCEDLPQVEIYDGGRHVAMTGQRVAGSDRDVVEGQSLIDTLVSEYAAAEKDAGHRRYDPESGDTPDPADESQTSADTSHTVPDPDTGAYLGPSADTLLETKPDDRSLTYHVVVETFYRGGGNTGGYAHIQNWRLEGFAAALGQRNDLSPQTVKRDLGGAYLADTDVEQGCVHRTPERIDYAFSRTNRGRLHPPSWETLADYGILPPEFLENDGSSSGEHGCEDDGRELLELDVVVEPAKAMRAARAVESDDLDCDLPELCRDDVDDVAIAVALADGRIDDPATFPRDDGYTDSYYRARDEYGAPLPKYLDNSTLAERFDHISAAVSQIGPEHILDELQSEIILENPPGQAIAKIDPVWEETSNPPSGRIVAGYGAGFWCAEHDQADSFSPLQLVALEHGIIDDESTYPIGESFKRAYRLLREEYGAPLPRWRATVLEEVPVLPSAVRILDEDLSATSSGLREIREQTQELVRDALTTRDRAQLVTVVPGGGKTFSTAIVADDQPILYAPPRNELKQQMEDYAAEICESDEFDAEPSAYHLPILAENRLCEEALETGVAAVRARGTDLLRDREALLEPVGPHLNATGAPSDSGDDGRGNSHECDTDSGEQTDPVDLDRATCPTADGDHDPEWRVALQVARALGFEPSVLHRHAQTLFGEPLPCEEERDCPYAEGWERIRDPGFCPDILIGGAGHAFVDSATSSYRVDGDNDRVADPRAVVIDEFPGDTYATEYDEQYMDHAVWLGEALVGVDNREALLSAGLNEESWVLSWLTGDGADVVAAADAIDALQAGTHIVDAVEAAGELLERGLTRLEAKTSANLQRLVDDLQTLTQTPPGKLELDHLLDHIGATADTVARDADNLYATEGRDAAGPLYELSTTLSEDIVAPLTAAATELDGDSLADAIADRTAELPIGGDLRRLVDDAAAAADGDAPRELLETAATALQGGRDGCQALAVAAADGCAHPDAWALLAGAIATPDDSGVSVHSQRSLSLGDADEAGLQHKNLTVNGADIHADRDHHGAVVFDRPDFTSADGENCPLVGLDATARRDLWRIALGRDAERRDIHDTAAARRRHIRESMNHTVIQTANTPLPYHGDPESHNFQEDLAVVRGAVDEYVGPDGLDNKGPAVISTLTVLKHLATDLSEIAGEAVNYEDMKGSDALGDHQVAVVLGSQHFGDSEPERWAMYASESADRGDTYGKTLDYGSEVANTYLKHMREDATMQAILRAGRNDQRSVVVAHTSALREDLPVVAEGVAVSAHSKGTLAVADAAAEFTHRSFTAADIAEQIQDDDRGVGIRQVQNILADLRSSGYLHVETPGKRGREYEYDLESDPGLADVELPEADSVDTPDAGTADSKTKSELLDTYSWNFGIDQQTDPDEGMLPPARPTIPATDTVETLADAVETPS